MIPQSFIQELLDRVDIADVVGKAVKLRKAGANLHGLCPFHNEKTPSFTVSPAKQFYHCFGCGAHGSAITFLMEHHGLGFVDAVKELAADVGLSVPQERGPGTEASAEATRRSLTLSQWLDQAAAYYRQRLKETPAAIAYLKKRGLTGEIARHFGLGYAPAGWRNLDGVLPDYAAAEAEECGLVIKGEDGRRYDRFRERVLFPIRNMRGRVIGFGGRLMGPGEPKYLNSPEGPLFSKRHELYGLFEAREAIRSQRRVLVVEGYMDVVTLHQHGCRYAVATLGTATTAAHLGKLMRLSDRIVFSFDGDAAGRKAAWRALENALPLLSDTKRLEFLFLPPEHDPDSYVQAHGLEAFEKQVDEALPLSTFLLRELSSRGDSGTPEGRARMQADLKPLVAQMPEIALRTQIVLEMASRLGVPSEDLFAYCGIGARSSSSRRPAANWQEQGGVRGPADGRSHSVGDGWRSRGGPRQDSVSFAGQGRGGGDWGGRGRDGRDRGLPPGILPERVRRMPPTLQQHVCLLLAYYPALAHEAVDNAEMLPAALLRWREQLAALPWEVDFAGVMADARERAPEMARFIENLDARDAGVLATMTPEAAAAAYQDALRRLTLAGAKQESVRLVAEGLDKPGVQTRYKEVEALKQRLTQELEGDKQALSDNMRG
ncbi:MAG: DNA primase [Lautropia sp.]|nr:DNA primase [Lautropia sp.]